MQTDAVPPRTYEFYFPDVDTLIRVETLQTEVIVRASRNTFTERRKRGFIHELAAEGFIPDDYEWLSLAGNDWSRGVRWFVDYSWLELDPAVMAETRRFMLGLIGGAVVLWVVMMTVVFLHAAR